MNSNVNKYKKNYASSKAHVNTFWNQ